VLGEAPPFWYDTREFEHAAAAFKGLGAAVFTRHVKSADEDPWWPTKVPLDPDGRPHSSRPRVIRSVTLLPRDDVARTIIDEAHRERMRILTYYWHASEATVAELSPEWICRRPRGTPMKSPRSVHLDITGPYRDVVLTRLLELAERGADGLFFDYRHLPREGCWHSALEEAWKAETGEPKAPRPPREGESPSARYLEFLDFRARKIEETFAYWRAKVKAKHPAVVFVVSTDDFAHLMDRGVTTRLARIADSAKNEYYQARQPSVERFFFDHKSELGTPEAHVRQSLSWTILRDSSDGRPPHIWHPGVPNVDQAVALAGSLLTFGAVANMDAYEGSLITHTDRRGKTPIEGLKQAFALGKRVSRQLAGSRPLRWAAVHFGERSRNQRGADYVAMWQHVLWPFLGPYQVLSEDGLPVGVVNDDQLERAELDGYSLLVLPNPNELTSAQARAVAAFKARGGAVLRNHSTWAWSDPTGPDAAATAFRAALKRHLRTAPLQVSGGPEGRYAVSFEKPGHLLVAVTNDFSWVQFSALNKPIPKPKINPTPPAATGVRISWRRTYRPPLRPQQATSLQPLRAVDAVSGTPLTVGQARGVYRVDLPPFQFMALLVVTHE
jgi:hypothetical protein